VPLLYGRCNPYGAETGGPKTVMGGLHGPASARTDPDDLPGLPEAVQQGEWACRNLAQVRVRMTCRCDHAGPVMDLCSWHEETVYHGEMVAGTLRRVRSVVKAPGHYEMIGRRQAGACIRCLYPGRFAEDYKALMRHQQELAYLRDAGLWYTPRAAHKRQVIEDIVKGFDAGQQSAGGPIHRCPMRLIPVS
jgi:hypothetical protein